MITMILNKNLTYNYKITCVAPANATYISIRTMKRNSNKVENVVNKNVILPKTSVNSRFTTNTNVQKNIINTTNNFQNKKTFFDHKTYNPRFHATNSINHNAPIQQYIQKQQICNISYTPKKDKNNPFLAALTAKKIVHRAEFHPDFVDSNNENSSQSLAILGTKINSYTQDSRITSTHKLGDTLTNGLPGQQYVHHNNTIIVTRQELRLHFTFYSSNDQHNLAMVAIFNGKHQAIHQIIPLPQGLPKLLIQPDPELLWSSRLIRWRRQQEQAIIDIDAEPFPVVNPYS